MLPEGRRPSAHQVAETLKRISGGKTSKEIVSDLKKAELDLKKSDG
jgi:hypothetical protein